MNEIVKITKRELIEAYVTRSREDKLLNDLLKQSNIGLSPNTILDITPDIVYTFPFPIPYNIITVKSHITYKIV